MTPTGKKRELAIMSEAMDRKRAEIEALVDRKQRELSQLLKTLIERGGFSLEAKDESGLTPLALSCSSSSNSKEYLEIARMMLAAGADVNSESARGSRPLHFACLNQNQVRSHPQSPSPY